MPLQAADTVILEFHSPLELNVDDSTETGTNLNRYHNGQPMIVILPDGQTDDPLIILPNMAIRHGYFGGHGLHRQR